MQVAVLCDFDGTVVYYDIFERLLDEFTSEDWRKYDYLVEEGKLRLEEAVEKQFDLIKYAGLEVLSKASEKYIQIRKGFEDFAKFCERNNIELVIVSAGLDFYIKKLFEKFKIKAKCYCMEVLNEDGILKLKMPVYDTYKYRSFKEFIVDEYKKKAFTIYIGDGFNDFFAARIADKVFAVKNSVLEKKCIDAKLNFLSFSEFNEILEFLKNLNDR